MNKRRFITNIGLNLVMTLIMFAVGIIKVPFAIFLAILAPCMAIALEYYYKNLTPGESDKIKKYSLPRPISYFVGFMIVVAVVLGYMSIYFDNRGDRSTATFFLKLTFIPLIIDFGILYGTKMGRQHVEAMTEPSSKYISPSIPKIIFWIGVVFIGLTSPYLFWKSLICLGWSFALTVFGPFVSIFIILYSVLGYFIFFRNKPQIKT